MNPLEVIEDLFETYGDDVYSYLIYFMGRQDVEALVQDVFIKALNILAGSNYESSPKMVLFSIASDVAIEALGKNQSFPLDSKRK